MQCRHSKYWHNNNNVRKALCISVRRWRWLAEGGEFGAALLLLLLYIEQNNFLYASRRPAKVVTQLGERAGVATPLTRVSVITVRRRYTALASTRPLPRLTLLLLKLSLIIARVFLVLRSKIKILGKNESLWKMLTPPPCVSCFSRVFRRSEVLITYARGLFESVIMFAYSLLP